MKKRLIGSLLFGALLVSSSSVFVSCADYDDDINANKAEIVAAQNEIAKLSSSLSALETELKTTKANLESQLTALESSFRTQIADAEGRLNAAIQDLKDGKADQATVDNLIKEVNDLKSAYEANKAAVQAKLDAIDKDIQTLRDLMDTKVDKSALDAAIATLQNLINNKVDKDTYNEAVARIVALEGKFDQLKDLINQVASEKAELSEFNNKVDNINKDIAALKELLNGKVSQEAFNTLEKTVDSLSAALEKVQTILNGKADQSSVDALNADLQAKYKELNDLIRTYVTPEQLNEKLNSAINLLRAELVALINQKAAQSDLQSVASELTALAKTVEALGNSKADNAEVKAQLAALEANLKNLIDTKADKKDVEESVKELLSQITALQAQTAAIETALATKAEQSYVEAQLASLKAYAEALVQAKADQTEIVRIDAAIKALETAINQKFIDLNNDIDSREAALKALIEALELGKADRTELQAVKDELTNSMNEKEEALTKALNLAVENINKTITSEIAAVNKRIDDVIEDLNAVRQDIVDILADLAAITGDIEGIESKFDKLIADLQDADTALDGKIAALDGIVNGHIEAYEIAKKALDQQVAALEAYKKSLEETIIPGLKEDLENASEELTKKIEKEVSDRIKAIDDLEVEIDGISADITTKYAELKNLIATNSDDIEDLDTRVKVLEEQFAKIDQKIADAIAANVENIMVYVSKVLKSISLVPQLYINGIEAIEFNSLSYVPAVGGTSGNPAIRGKGTVKETHIQRTGNAITIDNGTAEAYYTLSPANVKRESIDEDNIVYKSAIAETRATPYNGTETPVEFAGIAEWGVKGQAGLIKVNLKKTITGSLNLSQEPGYGGDIYIVNLNVPRKTQEVAGVEVDKENAIITSENHMLAEKTFTPRIARKAWRGATNKEYRTWFDPFADAEVKNGYNLHHYTDSATMWNQKVDANSSNDIADLHLVTATVNYNETFDVSKIVTACDIETPTDVKGFAGIDDPESHWYVENHEASHEITLAKLKSFGLEFRYYIPTAPYLNTVDHRTNQQIFAEIDEFTGILKSKVPVGLSDDQGYVYDNRACVGKEPIIRVELYDVNNKKIVDQRYLKIKWVEPTKGTVELDPFENTTKLIPCDRNYSGGITWRYFISQVYRKIADFGVSQKTFESVYPIDKVTYSNVKMSIAHRNMIQAAVQPHAAEAVNTTNEQGDALIADWWLDPQEIANIYPSQSKTFTCTIQFNSILPTEYPNIKFDWKWTITLPTFPVIVGYYDNYWLDATNHTIHDVLPVQYNTAMYHAIKDGRVVPGKDYGINAPAVGMQLYNKENNELYIQQKIAAPVDYCVFYNNLMNAFTYDVTANNWQNNKDPKYILKDFLGECSTWDMQFTARGSDYVDPSWIGYNQQGRTSYSYPQASVNGGYQPAGNTQSPSLNRIGWKTAGAYKLETKAHAQALQMEWWGLVDEDGLPDQTDGDHVAWEPNIWPVKYNHAILYADHHNEANQELLIDLLQDDEADGWTPKRDHESQESKAKAVHIGIWGTINDWNIAHIKDYDIYLVKPLRINADIKGAFEEGYVSGTAIRCEDAFEMRDFRGYEVGRGANGTTERTKYRNELYEYYEVEEPKWELDKVEYGMKYANGNITPVDADKDVKYKNQVSSWMTAKDIKNLTNGNIVLSIEEKWWPVDADNNPTANSVKYLVFKNNGGSNVESEVWISIPVWARYGFGKAQADAIVKLYPKGKAAAGVTILPYPGNN